MVHAGEKLKEERERRGLSIEEVAKATKIRSSFLLDIEKGKYEKLPSGTYALGFVKNYAKFLGLSEKELLALFKREYSEEKYIKVLPEGFARKDDFPIKKFKFAQSFKIAILVFVALLIYIFFQYRSAIFNPPLNVEKPKEGAIVSERQITVTGKTDSNSTVFINDQTASLDKNGNFEKTINVFPGQTTIVVKAVNNFNKETILTREIEVK